MSNKLVDKKQQNIEVFLNNCIEIIDINEDRVYIKLKKHIVIDNEQSIALVSGDMLVLQGDITHINFFKKREDISSIRKIKQAIENVLKRITNGK